MIRRQDNLEQAPWQRGAFLTPGILGIRRNPGATDATVSAQLV
jgi:hypothetical protein